jgi:pyrroline-5-carboxylate reductase
MVELFRGFQLQTSSERDNVRDMLLATLTYQKLTHHSFDAIVKEVANPGGLTGQGVQGICETFPAAFEHVLQRMETKIAERRGLLKPEVCRRTVDREIEQTG